MQNCDDACPEKDDNDDLSLRSVFGVKSGYSDEDKGESLI